MTFNLLAGSTGPSGPQGVPGPRPTIRSVAGTTDTLLAADDRNVVRYTAATDVTLTVPAGLNVGFSCAIIQRGAGGVIPTSDGTTVITQRQSHTKTAGAGAQATLLADTADHFIFAGDTV